MQLDKKTTDALKRLYHGSNREDFIVFLQAVGIEAGALNERYIYGGESGEALSLLKGRTRQMTDVVKAIEKALKQPIETEDT